MKGQSQWLYKSFTININQAAATYDLATALGGDVMIHPGLSSWYCDASAAGPTTSVSVQTDTANPTVLVTAVEGAVAGILIGINLHPAWDQPMVLKIGSKIQYTIAGGASAGQITATLAYRPMLPQGGTI